MTDAVSQGTPQEVRSANPRRPWLAALLSIVLAGLGQLYSGRPARGATVFALVVFADLMILALGVRLPPRLQLPFLFGGLIIVLALAAVDAARTAQSAGSTYHPRQYNRWYVYAGIILFFGLVVEPALVYWIKNHIVEAFRYASGAMQPTLKEGDYVFAVPTTEIRRGAVIVHERDGQKFLHRAVGLPGDTIQMRSGELWIKGARYPEPYAQPIRENENVQLTEARWQRRYLADGSDTSSYNPTMSDWGPLAIPPSNFFLLGDNRGESWDSRALGFIPANAIRARASSIYFSRDPDKGIRWDRVGLAVQ